MKRFFAMLSVLSFLAVGIGFFGCAGPAWAQLQARSSHRLEALFDFEDTDDRGAKIGYSSQLLPRYWYPIGRQPLGAKPEFRAIPLHDGMEHRAGYPSHAAIRFDRTQKTSGDFSFFLGLVGGKTGAYLQTGTVSVKAGSDYMVTASVKTRALRFAWAEVRVYFVDKAGNIITDSIQHSRPIQSEEDWQRNITIKLRGDFDDAAYIGIELLILQPQRDPTHPLGGHQIIPQDVEGGAYFDDIGIWELPRVELHTAQPSNLVVSPRKPELRASVRDLSGKQLTAHLNVYDLNNRLIDHSSTLIGRDGQSPQWTWAPDLPGYGWYITELVVYDDGTLADDLAPIARTLNALLWMPADPGELGSDLGRFMLIAEDVDDDDLPLVSELVRLAGIRGAVLSAWGRSNTPQTATQRQTLMDGIVRDLTLKGGKVALSFWPLPIELSTQLGIETNDPLSALAADPGLWAPYSKPVFIRHGQRVSDWQIGSSRHPEAFFTIPLDTRVDGIEAEIATMTPSPRMVIPWRLDQPQRPEVATGRRSFAVAWPQGITPANLDQALDGWPVPPEQMRLDIELAPAQQMSQPRRVADLVLRMLHAWELRVGSMGLDKPWADGYERRNAILPDPVLGAWVNTSRMLAGQEVIGRMPLGPGLRCMILDGRQGGMLAVWNENADSSTAEVRLFLGDAPEAVDPFGNRTPLPELGGRHVLAIGPTPTFITGIDPRLARLRASFTLDEPFIESRQVEHQRVLRLTNPFARTMNGALTITGPVGWQILPARHRFSIAPGRTIEIPLGIRFPIQEPGGVKSLTAQVQFETDDAYDITLYAPLELGLKDVEFDATVVLEPGQEPGTTDAVVTLTVTNRGSKRTSLFLFASLRDHPRREILVPGIEPGVMATRRMRFNDVTDQIGQFPLRCGVREVDGLAVLNHALPLDHPPAPQRPGPVSEAPAP